MSLGATLNIWLRCVWFHLCSLTVVHRGLLKPLQFMCNVSVVKPNPHVDVEVVIGQPDKLHWNSDAFRVGYTLWEARSFPVNKIDEIIRRVQAADLLVTSSEVSALAFRELPIDTPIEVVPLGYDPEEFYPVRRKWGLGCKTKFLLAGVVQPRKGSWLALEAFEKAFGRRHNVELTVWSTEKQSMLEKLKSEYSGNHRIKFSEEMVKSSFDMLRAHHVLLSPHLAEGFGLLIVEAMATGMPCIVSRCSAPLEFFNGGCGYWVEMTDDYIPVAYEGQSVAGFWRLPSVDSLSEQMREVVKHPYVARNKGIRGSEESAKLTWAEAARRLLETIRRYVDTG